MLERLGEVADELAEDLAQRVESIDPVARRALAAIALQLAARPGSRPSPRLTRTLEFAKILPGPAGECSSLADFRAELKRGRPIRFARKEYPRGAYDPPVVLLDAARAALDKILPAGPRRDVDEEVRLRLRRKKNHRAWEALPVEEPVLPVLEGCPRAASSAPDWRLEVALVSEETPVVRLRTWTIPALYSECAPVDCIM